MAGVEHLIPLVGIVVACAVLCVSRASFYRTKSPPKPRAPRPRPPRALDDAERAEVLAVLDSDRFADKAPRRSTPSCSTRTDTSAPSAACTACSPPRPRSRNVATSTVTRHDRALVEQRPGSEGGRNVLFVRPRRASTYGLMPCPQCNCQPCRCVVNLLTVLSKEDGGDNILRWIPMNQLVSVLQTSKATNQITRTHITRRVQGGRSQMLRLFQDDGALFDVYKLIDCATPGEITIYSHPYDENKPVAALRAGHFLAFVAVAILNDCDALCFGMFGKRAKSWEYGVVVVTALVVHGVHRHLIIALNGGSDRCRKIYEDYCTAAKFLELIGVHSVHVVHNSDPPHKSLVSFVGEHALTKEQLERWLLDSSEHGGQDWHGEQKILQYIGDTFGFDMKKFVLCLGISHLAGPCTDDTTATQHCKEFLEAMRRSDVSFVGREAGHVMGFWLGGGSHSRKLNPIYKLFFRLLE